MSFLTGKAAKSSNQAYGYLKDTYAPQVQTGVQANNALAGLLGIGGDPAAAQTGYQNFLNSAGYQNVLKQSNAGITGSAAARGLLGSGSTLKALQNNSANLGANYFSQYLQQLGGLGTSGVQAGSLIGGAGGTQTGGTQGLFGAIGNVASGIGSAAAGLAKIPGFGI